MSAEPDTDSLRMRNTAEWICSKKRIKGKGSTHGRVAHKGYCETRWKGAKMDSDRDDFSRKGSRRGMLKITKKGEV